MRAEKKGDRIFNEEIYSQSNQYKRLASSLNLLLWAERKEERKNQCERGREKNKDENGRKTKNEIE